MQEFEIDYRGVLREYGGRSEHVKVPEDVTYIGSFAFVARKFMKSVELPEYTMHIMKSAFLGCKGLESVTMSEYLPDIGECAFGGCASLKHIHLPKHLEKIGKEAFYGSGLEEISIPDSVQELGEGAFQYCQNLKSVKLPAGLTKIPKNTFFGCDMLSEITIPETVTKIEAGSFYRCISLKELYLPDNIDYINQNAIDYAEPVQIIYHGIRFSTVAEQNQPVSCSDGVDMIKNYDFHINIFVCEKVRILIQMLRKTPQDRRLTEYLRTGYVKLMRVMIKENFIESITEFASAGELIQKEHIDDLIRYAIDSERTEIQVFLTNYKREHFGFESIEERAKRLLLE